MAKVRFQMFLEENQKEVLERLQKDLKIPTAEIVRMAIDRFLTEWRKKKQIPLEGDMTEKLLSIGGVCKGGPRNLADEHDKYLYGTSKK